MSVGTRLLLTRHGEAACNVSGTVGGDAGCAGLTANGREQVSRLGERLAREHDIEPFDVLYASPRLRCRESGHVLAEALGLPVIHDAALAGPHHGDADGMPWDEVKTTFAGPPQAYPHLQHAPGAETWFDYLARSYAVLAQVLAKHEGQKVLIAAHGETIEAANGLLLELPLTACLRTGFVTGHSSLTRWERHTNRFQRTIWNLAAHNDTAHLR